MELIRFLGWEGIYALFEVQKGRMPNNRNLDTILISHEGNWLEDEAMICHQKYKRYEDVQFDLGRGLLLLRKWFSPEESRSYFEYKILLSNGVLAVPATGEEINFEIYGQGSDRQPLLLLKREL